VTRRSPRQRLFPSAATFSLVNPNRYLPSPLHFPCPRVRDLDFGFLISLMALVSWCWLLLRVVLASASWARYDCHLTRSVRGRWCGCSLSVCTCICVWLWNRCPNGFPRTCIFLWNACLDVTKSSHMFILLIPSFNHCLLPWLIE